MKAIFWQYTGNHPAGESNLIDADGDISLGLAQWVYREEDDATIEYGPLNGGFGHTVTVTGTPEQWKVWERRFNAELAS